MVGSCTIRQINPLSLKKIDSASQIKVIRISSVTDRGLSNLKFGGRKFWMPLIVVPISENARNDVNAAIGRYTCWTKCRLVGAA